MVWGSLVSSFEVFESVQGFGLLGEKETPKILKMTQAGTCFLGRKKAPAGIRDTTLTGFKDSR